MRKYRGKYPNRIQAVWTNRKAIQPILNGLYVKTNNGVVYKLKEHPGMNYPMLGTDISEYELTEMQPQ